MHTFSGITILGLGPGSADLLNTKAIEWLSHSKEVYLKTLRHPATGYLQARTKVYSLVEQVKQLDTTEEINTSIVQKVIALGQREEGVTYAVPGNPLREDPTTRSILTIAESMNIPTQLIEGVSYLDATLSLLGLETIDRLVIVEGSTTSMLYFPPFPPDHAVLITHIDSKEMAQEISRVLACNYPKNHPIKLVIYSESANASIITLPLSELERNVNISAMCFLFVPALDREASFEHFQAVIAQLRSPEGCPWDREQSHKTLRSSLLEETYETLEALDTQDMGALQEELGDLLLQIVLHSQISFEEGSFRMTDVLRGVSRKLIRRHPHVFKGENVDGVEGVLKNWEAIKARERETKTKKGILDGIPSTFPSLSQAQEYQKRAARVGFDWQALDPVVDKIHEEMEEVFQASDFESQSAEIGDLLFAVVNLARWFKVDAESALRQANIRFRNRFSYIEHKTRLRNVSVSTLSLEEMDVLWEEAKANGL